MWSCDVRPRRFSVRCEPVSNGTRVGCSSLHQRPGKVMSSSHWLARGNVTPSASSRYVSVPRFVTELVASSTPLASSVSSHVSSNCATESTLTVRRVFELESKLSSEKRGAQAVPSEWQPRRPGRPGKPAPCSGTSDSGATTSNSPCRIGRASAVRTEANEVLDASC